MDKWLAHIGIFFHEFRCRPSKFHDVSVSNDRKIIECQTCGTVWSWDR